MLPLSAVGFSVDTLGETVEVRTAVSAAEFHIMTMTSILHHNMSGSLILFTVVLRISNEHGRPLQQRVIKAVDKYSLCFMEQFVLQNFG